MATPDFVIELRESIGHAPLWLPGVTAVVLREEHGVREVLLVKRADNGAWTPVTGIVDPGEEPAVAAAREVLEEAGVRCVVRTLKWVHAIDLITYANGDQSRYLDLTFECAYEGGEPHPADGENTAAAWFRLDDLPEMSEEMRARVFAAVWQGDACRFEV